MSIYEDNPIEEWAHLIYGRSRQKAERCASLSLDMMAKSPKARGPLVAYVVASALAEELTLNEMRIRRLASCPQY